MSRTGVIDVTPKNISQLSIVKRLKIKSKLKKKRKKERKKKKKKRVRSKGKIIEEEKI